MVFIYSHVLAAEQNDAVRKQCRWKDSYDCIDCEGLLLFLTQGGTNRKERAKRASGIMKKRKRMKSSTKKYRGTQIKIVINSWPMASLL